jgi:hypothetical protein
MKLFPHGVLFGGGRCAESVAVAFLTVCVRLRRMLGGSTFRSLARYTNDRWQHLPDLQFRRRLSAEGVKPESNN